MTTALEIITQAFRESNLIAIGTLPKEAEQAEGLTRLNVLVSSVIGHEVGENLNDWQVGAENIDGGLPGWGTREWSRPLPNSRLLVSSSEAQTIYMPPSPDNGARIAIIDVIGNFATNNLTVLGNGRLVEGAQSVTLDEDSIVRSWLYQSDLAQWVRIEALTLESTMPYPIEFDEVFITKLAMRLNPRYGRSVDSQTVDAMNSAMSALQARYRQKRNVGVDSGVTSLTTSRSRTRYVDPYLGDGT